MQKVARRRWLRVLFAALVLIVPLMLANLWVRLEARPHVVDAAQAERREFVVVLGAAVRGEVPSPVLERRLAVAARLFDEGKAERVLVSGKREPPWYDETRAMRRWLEDHGVPAERILEDPLGYRTFETFRRARDEYGVERCLVVTNGFHIERSVFLARRLGIDALGVPSEDEGFSTRARLKWGIREAGARVRAVWDILR